VLAAVVAPAAVPATNGHAAANGHSQVVVSLSGARKRRKSRGATARPATPAKAVAKAVAKAAMVQAVL
jgi:hypothetical protein